MLRFVALVTVVALLTITPTASAGHLTCDDTPGAIDRAQCITNTIIDGGEEAIRMYVVMACEALFGEPC